jgi:hypothetical protein
MLSKNGIESCEFIGQQRITKPLRQKDLTTVTIAVTTHIKIVHNISKPSLIVTPVNAFALGLGTVWLRKLFSQLVVFPLHTYSSSRALRGFQASEIACQRRRSTTSAAIEYEAQAVWRNQWLKAFLKSSWMLWNQGLGC